MNQAQGAIDAARAAGADTFAADEFRAAVDALARSEEAVQAGDYRQALSHALDSRERAQNAAKMAVDSRAYARGDAERAIAEVATLLARADARLKDPAVTRLPRGTLSGPRATIGSTATALQEARSALAKEDYRQVKSVLNGILEQLQVALKAIDSAASATPGRKR
jgi:glutathione S-transferase